MDFQVISSLWRDSAFCGKMKHTDVCSINLRKKQRRQEHSRIRKTAFWLNFIDIACFWPP